MQYQIDEKLPQEAKPNWDIAPYWANFLAHDLCGRWYWYATRPTPFYTGFLTYGKSLEVYKHREVWQCGRYQNWKESLEERPQ